MRFIAGNAVSAKTTTNNLQRRYGAFCFIPSAFPVTHQRAALHLDIHQQPPSAGEQQDNDADLSHHQTVALRPTKRRP